MRLLLACCLFVFGCDASKQVEEFADKACACKDATCGKTVLNDFVGWAEKNKDARGDEERAQRELKRMFECVVKSGVGESDVMDAVDRMTKMMQ